jgi:hypothetical protein
VLAEGKTWKGELPTAKEYAALAIAQLSHGTHAWFDAVAVAIHCDGQRGDNDGVARWLAAASPATATGSCDAQIICLCRGAGQLLFAKRVDEASVFLARADALAAASPPGPLARAWRHRAQAERYLMQPDVGRCMDEYLLTIQAFERAGALRLACLAGLHRMSWGTWLAAPKGGPQLARLGKEAERLGVPMLLGFTRMSVTSIDLTEGRYAEVARFAEEATKFAPKSSPRIVQANRMTAAMATLMLGDLPGAEAHARAVIDLGIGGSPEANGRGIYAIALTRQGRATEALPYAREGLAVVAADQRMDLQEGWAELGYAETLDALGDREGAMNALRAGVARLSRAIATMPDSAWRARYLARGAPNAQIVALAKAWGMDVPQPS